MQGDNGLPDFEPSPVPSVPAPRKPRPCPQRKRPAKKATKRAVLPTPKRVPKKRRARKPVQYGTAEQKVAAGRAYVEDARKMEFTAFVELLFGFKLEPWQVRLIKALEQYQK